MKKPAAIARGGSDWQIDIGLRHGQDEGEGCAHQKYGVWLLTRGSFGQTPYFSLYFMAAQPFL